MNFNYGIINRKEYEYECRVLNETSFKMNYDSNK